MTLAFLFNRPYPTAPFSTLFLFGRGQDTGFQKAIGDSPRKRHHVRFWAMSLTTAENTLGTGSFWSNTEPPAEDERVLWVGAGTRDTGLSLTRLTLKITHATDAATSEERDYIVAELARHAAIGDVRIYGKGENLVASHINHYMTDGCVSVAELTA